MADTGVISRGRAKGTWPARPIYRSSRIPTGTYFADWVAPEARDAFESDFGEVKVKTTLDADLQRLAVRAVSRAATGDMQAALVAMRPDGRVVAMVGGKNYGDSPFNRATQARRQPGSAFKLFVYLAALRAGWTPDSKIDDRPITIDGWTPPTATASIAARLRCARPLLAQATLQRSAFRRASAAPTFFGQRASSALRLRCRTVRASRSGRRA